MLAYLGDLMEDATDFTWANAKAAHAVLLCEMERGVLKWADTSLIERIRRAHAQKHSVTKQNWGKNQENKRPWFCKQFQSGACNFFRNHEVSGRLHRHICAYCLSQGRQLVHAEKDCHFARKNGPKNDQGGCSARSQLGSKHVKSLADRKQSVEVYGVKSKSDVQEKCNTSVQDKKRHAVSTDSGNIVISRVFL